MKVPLDPEYGPIENSPFDRGRRYVLAHGWEPRPCAQTKLTFWADPMRPRAAPLWLHEAVDRQQERDRAVKGVMES